MTRTVPLLVAGALLSVGCQQQPAVYGNRSYQSNVYGNTRAYPRTNVYGNATFRDPVDGSPEYARRPSDGAQPASVAVRTEPTLQPQPEPPSIRQPAEAPVDEVARSAPARGDVDRADRPVASDDRRVPITSERPVAVVPPPSNPAVTPPAVERPSIADARAEARPAAGPDVAHDVGQKTSPTAPDGRDPEMVARAASARYPDDLKPSEDLQAVAVFDRGTKSLRVVNHSGQEILGGNLWVSETYVTPIPNLPAGGSTSVLVNQFFNRDGKMLPTLNDVNKLQFQTAGKLYNLRLEGGAELNK
jgi:hypothetical protein